MPNRFEITTKTILYLVLIVAGGWLLIQIRDVLGLLFIAFIITSALRSGVDWMEKVGVPRILGVITLYAVLVGTIIGFGTVVLPPLVAETIRLGTNLPQYLAQLSPYVNTNIDSLIQQIAPIGQNVAKVTIGVFNNILTFFTVAVFAYYFLLEHKHLRQFLDMFVGDDIGDRVVVIIRKIEGRLGAWVRGEVILMLIVGLATYLGLTVLGVNYALPLALIAGLLEIVPIIGPIISAIPAVLVALTVSPGLGLAVVALYLIVQQLENNIIVPNVMQKAVGLPPMASLLALLIGGRLAGTVGIILAVPMLLVLQTVVQEFTSSQTGKIK